MKLGIGPQGSPKQIANEIISLCKDLDGSGTFLDVGSGWGSMLVPLAKALPDWTFYGIEKSPTPWFVSQFRTMKNNSGNINLFLGDAEKFRYRGYDIIYLNVPKKMMNELTPPLLRNIERGSLVITYRNQIDGLTPFNNMVVKDDRGMDRQIYLYANAATVQQPTPAPTEQVATPQAQPTPAPQSGETHVPEPQSEAELELEPKPETQETPPKS